VRPGTTSAARHTDERIGLFATKQTLDGRVHICTTCDYEWPVADVYARWPIRLKWGAPRSSAWFTSHGWQLGTDHLWRRVFGWTFHLGRLKVCFGRSPYPYRPAREQRCPACRTLAWKARWLA
jgi:hypothetical protein